jgi:hypothetical protein
MGPRKNVPNPKGFHMGVHNNESSGSTDNIDFLDQVSNSTFRRRFHLYHEFSAFVGN